jgi:ribosome-binding protein aMBF1 (putative translation factor)
MSQTLMTLKTCRDWRCLSQEDLASAAQVNISTIREAEQQRTYPRPSTRRKIAAALGVQPWEIVWRESQK